jgi:hypothetical protein
LPFFASGPEEMVKKGEKKVLATRKKLETTDEKDEG